MKRIAIITTHPIQYYAPLFNALAEEDIELKVFYTWGLGSVNKYDPGFKRTVEWDIPLLDGYDFEFLENNASDPGSHHFNGIKNPSAVLKIKSFKPDVILIFGWGYHSHLNIIRQFKSNIPIWFRGDSTLLDDVVIFKKFIRLAFLRWVYSHVDLAFYVGSNNKKYFNACGLREDQLVFSPHAIDNNRFAKDRSYEASLLRKKLNIGKEQVLILFAGKLEEKKNPALLLEAFINLQNSNLALLFVGSGNLENPLKAIATKSSLKIHFMSFQNQNQMPVVYQACDLFCLPSKGPGETWGLAVNEAMAAGKAILISDKVGCGEDLVKPGRNGEIFRYNSQEDLINKLKQMTQLETLTGYGQESKSIIQDWNLNKSLKGIISALKT